MPKTLPKSTVGSGRICSPNWSTINSTPGTPRAESKKCSYIKMAMTLINENLEESKLARQLVLDDYNRLTTEQMLKIVTFLLKRAGHRDIKIQLPATLSKFYTFGVGGFDYDCGIDHVYHAVRPIFPQDTKVFDFSVLLLPARQPSRTKAVISFITRFILMCDKLHEEFGECYEETMKENEEKTALFAELDDLRNEIHKTIQEHEKQRNGIPVLKNELQHVQDAIGECQIELAEVKGKLQDQMSAYQEEETKITALNDELNQINVEVEMLQQCVVANPEGILAEKDFVQKQFDAEIKKREELGEEMKKYERDCEAYARLIQQVEHTIQSMETQVEYMKDATEKTKLEQSMVDDNKSLRKEIELRQLEQVQLTRRHEQVRGDLSRMQTENKAEFDGITDEITIAKKQIEFAKSSINDLHRAYLVICDTVKEYTKEVELLQEFISKYIYSVHVTIPQNRAQQKADADEMAQRILGQFNYFPEL